MRRFSEDPYSNDEFEINSDSSFVEDLNKLNLDSSSDYEFPQGNDEQWKELNKFSFDSSSDYEIPKGNYEFDADQVEEFPKGNEEEWINLNYSNFKELIDILNNEKSEKYKVAVILLEPWDSIQYYNLNPGRLTTLNIKFNDQYYVLDMFYDFGTAELLESNPKLYYNMDFEGNITQANDTRYKISFKNKNNETGVL